MADLKPKAPVRRFDVFAEYNRLDAMKKGEKRGTSQRVRLVARESRRREKVW